MHAVLDGAALRQSNALLLAFSAAHVGATLVLVKQAGAVGLVAADALNMLLRIAYSAWWVAWLGRPGRVVPQRRALAAQALGGARRAGAAQPPCCPPADEAPEETPSQAALHGAAAAAAAGAAPPHRAASRSPSRGPCRRRPAGTSSATSAACLPSA